MDSVLRKRLEKFEQQITVLSRAELEFRTLEAAKEHKLASLMNEAPTTLTSDASKKSWAYGTDDWLSFKKALAIAEAEYNKEKHFLELKRHAFTAEYLGAKIEQEAIKKQI